MCAEAKTVVAFTVFGKAMNDKPAKVAPSPKCLKCGYVMCQLFDYKKVNDHADIAIPNGQFICYGCRVRKAMAEAESKCLCSHGFSRHNESDAGLGRKGCLVCTCPSYTPRININRDVLR